MDPALLQYLISRGINPDVLQRSIAGGQPYQVPQGTQGAGIPQSQMQPWQTPQTEWDRAWNEYQNLHPIQMSGEGPRPMGQGPADGGYMGTGYWGPGKQQGGPQWDAPMQQPQRNPVWRAQPGTVDWRFGGGGASPNTAMSNPYQGMAPDEAARRKQEFQARERQRQMDAFAAMYAPKDKTVGQPMHTFSGKFF